MPDKAEKEIGFEQLEQRLAVHEKKIRLRGLALTLIPIAVAVFATWFATSEITSARRRLVRIQTQQAQAAATLKQVVDILQKIQNSIDSKVEAARSPDEARSIIDLRLTLDPIEAEYKQASKNIQGLPALDQRVWVTFLMSSTDLKDCRGAARTWSSKVDPPQLAIYKAPNGYYGLALKGDGTFTGAYNSLLFARQNGSPQAYWAPAQDWGTDYLK